MNAAEGELQTRRRRSRLPLIMVLATIVACALALFLRDQLYGRYWAYQLARTPDPVRRVAYVAALANLGDDAAWGASALMRSSDAELRQLGVVVLQQMRTSWADAQLGALLDDEDGRIRELAAVGLAARRDPRALPALQTLFLTGDDASARAACNALATMRTSQATLVLIDLAGESARPGQLAAVIDSLSGLRDPDAVPTLLGLLDDQRSIPADAAPLDEFLGEGATTVPTSMTARAITVSRAAVNALAHITGIKSPPESELSESARERARQRWRAWYDARGE